MTTEATAYNYRYFGKQFYNESLINLCKYMCDWPTGQYSLNESEQTIQTKDGLFKYELVDDNNGFYEIISTKQ